MTEEQAHAEPGAKDQARAGAAAPGDSNPAEASEASPQTDRLVADEEGEEPRRGLLSRLNPLRLFQRQSPDFFVREGRDLLENGSLAQATVAFQHALELDDGCAPAHRGLGKVFYKKGGRSNLDTALKHYQEAVRLAPMEHDLYAITAKIYDALGKRKEATLERKKFVIVRALEGDPNNAIANNNMGILFLQQDRVDDALDYFNRAIKSDRHFDVAHRNLAATYYQLAKKEMDQGKKGDLVSRARGELEKALSIQISVPSLLAYARILMHLGEFEKALESAEQADALDPANKDVFLIKKLCLERLGRLEEAKLAGESYQQFLRGDDDPDEE